MTTDPHRIDTASPWIERWAHLVVPGARVLDVACGSGRHARFFSARGCSVTAVDRDLVALESLAGIPGIETVRADLEADPWPFMQACFDAIVVTNYLHRPLFPHLVGALAVGGVVFYETFMQGNEVYGKPSNPAFLLAPGELSAAFGEMTFVAAFEQGLAAPPRRAVIQRMVAVRRGGEKLPALAP